jgi:hypothetical protein
MRTSTRRKVDVALLAGGGVVVGVVALIGAAGADSERIANFWISAQLQSDGSAQVAEVIDYDFGIVGEGTARHGIERIVPGLDPAAPVQVSSDDAPDGLQVMSDPAGTKLRIGDPNQTVTGEHRYRIDYPLPGVARGTVFDWETFGDQWTVPIEHAEVHLLAPFELRDVRCFQGGRGASGSCSVREVAPGHVVAEVEDLDAREGVSLEGTTGGAVAAPAAPSPPADRPAEPGTGLLAPAGVGLAGALVAAAGASRLVRRAGRERVAAGGAADAAYAANTWAGPAVPAMTAPGDFAPTGPPAAPPGGFGGPVQPVASAGSAGEVRLDVDELGEMATTDFAPPEYLTPPQGGIVLTEQVRTEHKVAWLIDAAIDGAVQLDEAGDKVTGLTRTGPGDAETGPLLDMAFAGRSQISLGSYDEDFAQAWGEVGQSLERWHTGSGFWDRGADSRRIVVRVLGVLVALLGLALAAGGGYLCNSEGRAWLPLVAAGAALTGAGLAATIRGWELRVRTPAGSAAWLRVESFRRFLAGSEAYHAEEAAKRGVLREYTAWAVALGEIDRWAHAVRSSTAIPADAGVSFAYMAPLLMMSTMSTSTAPSSSGSGFSGGGFGGGSVGGGAGGGGGGSW